MSVTEETFSSDLAQLDITRNPDGSLNGIQLTLLREGAADTLGELSIRECHNHKTINTNGQVASSDHIVTTAVNQLKAHPKMNVVHFVYTMFAGYQSHGMAGFDLVRTSLE